MTAGSARALAFAAVVVVVLARSGAGALGPAYGGRVTVELAELPARFDPAAGRGAGARLLAALVHERLFDLRDGVAEPALAQSWSSSAEGREWTIRLRPGATFHDGAPIVAADVARSLRRFLRSPSSAASGFAARVDGGTDYRGRSTEDLAGVAVADPLTVVLRVREGSFTTLAFLAAPDAAITSARGAGAGPFVPTTASPLRGRFAAVAFPAHVRGRPFLDSVALHAAVAGDSGPRADLVPAIGPGPLAATLLLVLDPAHPALARVEQRRAVAAAIDRDDLVRNFLPGGAAAVSPIPALLLPARPGRATARPSPATGSVVLAVSSDVPRLISQRVVAQLGARGLSATAVEVTPDNAWTIRAAARLIAWTPEAPDPLLALEELALLAPWPGREVLARAARETDRDRREALLHRAEAALRDQSTVLALAALPLGYRGRPGLHGVGIDAAGRIRLENAWITP